MGGLAPRDGAKLTPSDIKSHTHEKEHTTGMLSKHITEILQLIASTIVIVLFGRQVQTYERHFTVTSDDEIRIAQNKIL